MSIPIIVVLIGALWCSLGVGVVVVWNVVKSRYARRTATGVTSGGQPAVALTEPVR